MTLNPATFDAGVRLIAEARLANRRQHRAALYTAEVTVRVRQARVSGMVDLLAQLAGVDDTDVVEAVDELYVNLREA